MIENVVKHELSSQEIMTLETFVISSPVLYFIMWLCSFDIDDSISNLPIQIASYLLINHRGIL
jgi:hypothetical protein